MRFPASWLSSLGDQADAIIATVQHALARGVESVFQLEEGEILVEPTPNKNDRRALFFYEAAEGGAGALSRLISDGEMFRAVAREALTIMHYVPASFEAARTAGPAALAGDDDARCVAGCYRCLLSYFNQPDHELIDRQNHQVLQFLLRLAHAEAGSATSQAHAVADLDGCPPPDIDPLVIGNLSITWIWRSARIAALDEIAADNDVGKALSAKGVKLIVLPTEPRARNEALAELRDALAGVSA
jgi:hypothetical protein